MRISLHIANRCVEHWTAIAGWVLAVLVGLVLPSLAASLQRVEPSLTSTLRPTCCGAVQSMATMLSARSKKIVKEKGVEADEFEEQVAQVCAWELDRSIEFKQLNRQHKSLWTLLSYTGSTSVPLCNTEPAAR